MINISAHCILSQIMTKYMNTKVFINIWSPAGSFMVQKMAITYPTPAFEGLIHSN